MHKSPRFKMPSGSKSRTNHTQRPDKHFSKLAVYIPIKNVVHPQSHYHLTQENCTSVSQHFKNKHFKSHSQKLCIFHLHVFLISSSLNSFLFRSSEFIRSCTFLEYIWLANMVILLSLLALIILSNTPCATFQDKNLA